MTLRLVGLMGVVLLLSLAAFGLLVSHYEKGVMEELPRTASAVGQAALRTLEWNVVRTVNRRATEVEAGGSDVDRRVRVMVQAEESGLTWKAGPEMNSLPSLKDAYLWLEDALIADYGPMHQLSVKKS